MQATPWQAAYHGARSHGKWASRGPRKANATSGDHPAIALSGLEQLKDGALLTLSVLTDSKAKLLEYSIGIHGRGKTSGAPWYARIDLTEEPEGEGPCGHPLLHCHVGLDPSTQGEPETRVPLPFLAPAEALDWLLATVDRRLEPSEAELYFEGSRVPGVRPLPESQPLPS
jgi:hypothetical protein